LISEEEDIINVATQELQALDIAYSQMQDDKKWKLSTGKCVEDELYKFAKKCIYEQ
jgi:hypothetical protein